MTPACTTTKQYADWQEVARFTPLTLAGFCADCTPGYQARMKQAGKCDSPHIKFNDEGGYLPKGEE